MEIIVGKTAGFCMGVKRAIESAKEETKKSCGKVTYCLGDLAHNPQVMQSLEKNGLKVINSLEEIPKPNGKNVIFRAHGVKKEIYEQAKNLGLEIIDLTCPSVLAIHKLAKQNAQKGKFIFFIGEKGHPEVIGTESFCGSNYATIETEEDLNLAIKKAKSEDIKELFIIAQTTFRMEKFEEFVLKIKQELNEKAEIEVKNTICNATRLRQEETESLSKQVDYMIIIGGKKSSNTNKLYDISLKNCKKAIMIESANELTEKLLQEIKACSKVGIMAGASTPQESIIEVKQKLQ